MKKTIYTSDEEDGDATLEFGVNKDNFLFILIESNDGYPGSLICLDEESVEDMIQDLQVCLETMKSFK